MGGRCDQFTEPSDSSTLTAGKSAARPLPPCRPPTPGRALGLSEFIAELIEFIQLIGQIGRVQGDRGEALLWRHLRLSLNGRAKKSPKWYVIEAN